jgi:hypothetical protein
MTEKHYVHFAASYVVDEIRANFGCSGLVPKAEVIPLRRAKKT